LPGIRDPIDLEYPLPVAPDAELTYFECALFESDADVGKEDIVKPRGMTLPTQHSD